MKHLLYAFSQIAGAREHRIKVPIHRIEILKNINNLRSFDKSVDEISYTNKSSQPYRHCHVGFFINYVFDDLGKICRIPSSYS